VSLPRPTRRLAFRSFLPSDLEDVFALLGDPEVMRFSRSGAHPDRTATVAWIEKAAMPHRGFSFGPTAILERARERVVGLCHLAPTEAGEVEIAYRVRRDRWGNGIATEAAATWLDFGFCELGLQRIVAFIDPANLGSLRVATKLGMAEEGEMLYQGFVVRRFALERRH
jgi:RimJ/RimL family protein N-acetyltransferase